LLFKTLELRTFDQQLDLLLEANIKHNMQSIPTRTTKNNTPSMKSFKRGPRTQKHLEKLENMDYITQGYVLGKF
jgi:hypothetical protein